MRTRQEALLEAGEVQQLLAGHRLQLDLMQGVTLVLGVVEGASPNGRAVNGVVQPKSVTSNASKRKYDPAGYACKQCGQRFAMPQQVATHIRYGCKKGGKR